MSGIDLVIFDCDGVLIDSERIAVRFDVAMLAELGLHLTEQQVVERFMGRSYTAMFAEIERELGRVLGEDWHEATRRRYEAALEAELTPVDGVPEALAAIDLPTCVASSSTHAALRHSLGVVGLHDTFAGRIFSAEDVAHGKPAPDLFLHAAATMGADPAACVVVEDSRYGVEAARRAGMRALGFAARGPSPDDGGSLTPREWLEGPDTIVFDDMRALPALLDQLA